MKTAATGMGGNEAGGVWPSVQRQLKSVSENHCHLQCGWVVVMCSTCSALAASQHF